MKLLISVLVLLSAYASKSFEMNTLSPSIPCPFKLKPLNANCKSQPSSYDDLITLKDQVVSSNFLSIYGGKAATATPVEKVPFLKKPVTKVLLATWGVFQVVAVLGNAIRRLIPIALQPFKAQDLLPFHWGLFGVWVVYMVYAEGYQAFQLKFSPLVVERAFGLNENLTPLRFLLAGPYSMGLFGATKKRMIVSRAVTAAVVAVVVAVKRLPYPYRSIIDAGVVAGLSYGSVATLVMYIKGLFGKLPGVDPCLPGSDDKKTK